MACADPFGANLGSSLLLTDLYQLNMLQAYRDAGGTAVFEFFVHRLAPHAVSSWPRVWSRRSSSGERRFGEAN